LLFARNVIIVELLFALGPIVLFALFNSPEDAYNELSFASRLSYPVVATAVLALIQALVVIAVFALWYGRTYEIDSADIINRGGGFSVERHVVATQSIRAVEVDQGRFGRRFDYGTLNLKVRDSAETITLKYIPSPHYNARRIEQLIEPADEAIAEKQMTVDEMIIAGEGQFIEFKASFLWDYRRQSVNKDLNVPTMKNVAAYMNSAGGVLLLGVDDEGEILGLENDFQAIKKPNVDGYENVLNMAFNSMIGAEFRHYLDIRFETFDEGIVCVLAVTPSAYPVFLQAKGKESFYIRTGNSSQPLEMSQAVRYIQSRFSAENNLT
jgi:membrane protein YdbS with pleckstrin-like domain